MLHAISWKEYFTLMGVGLLIYYGWWLVRYYSTLRIGGAGKADQGRQVLPEAVKKVEDGKSEPVTAKAVGVIGEPDQAKAEESSAKERHPAVEPDGAGTGVAAERLVEAPGASVAEKPAHLPEVAGDLSNKVKDLVQMASETKMSEADLVLAFQQLLKKEPNDRLLGTHFEKKICEQIVAELERHGPVRVDVAVVTGWWR